MTKYVGKKVFKPSKWLEEYTIYAVDEDGKKVSIFIMAESEDEACLLAEDWGYQVLDIHVGEENERSG